MLGAYVLFAVVARACAPMLGAFVFFAVAARARAPMLGAHVLFTVAMLAGALKLFDYFSIVLFTAATVEPQAC